MGIKSLGGILIVILLGLGIAWWQGWILPSGDESNQNINPNNTPPPENAMVKRIIDPITIELESGHIIRYIGVRTPDITSQVECFGKEALLANESVLGKQVRLKEEPLLVRSSDGAWTRYVFLEESPKPEVQNPKQDQSSNEENTNEEPQAEDVVPDLEGLAEQVKDTIPESDPHVTPDRDPGSSPIAENLDSGSEAGMTDEEPAPTDEKAPEEILINERILEGGFGFPVVSEDMVYGERMLSAARFASATGKGLWSRCEVDSEAQPLRTQKVDSCIIKGKVTNTGEKLYRTPECPAYQQTIPIQAEGGAWFCAEDIATDAGFTKAPDCP